MNLLIIEDEPIIRKNFIKMIDMIDLVQFKVNNLQAVEYAEDAIPLLNKNKYDLVFVDLKGGDLDGLTLINMWHNKLKNTEWIIITGYDKFEYAQEAISYGVSDYLLKPITLTNLRKSIERSMYKRNKEKIILPLGYIDSVTQDLESNIWRLDRFGIINLFQELKSKLSHCNISVSDYSNLLMYVIKKTVSNLNTKGRKVEIELDVKKTLSTKDEANELFISICDKMIDRLSLARKGNELDPIVAAKKYIEENIVKEITLEEIAKVTGFNPSYFSQLFRRETGETFVNYRTKLRMERAKEILLRRDIRIIDIPYKIGMNDHPHFIKVFKKYVGLTPSEYREKMGVD